MRGCNAGARRLSSRAPMRLTDWGRRERALALRCWRSLLHAGGLRREVERRPCGRLLTSGCAPERRPRLAVVRHRKLRVSGYGLSEAYQGPAQPFSSPGSACASVTVRRGLCALVCVDPRDPGLEGHLAVSSCYTPYVRAVAKFHGGAGNRSWRGVACAKLRCQTSRELLQLQPCAAWSRSSACSPPASRRHLRRTAAPHPHG